MYAECYLKQQLTNVRHFCKSVFLRFAMNYVQIIPFARPWNVQFHWDESPENYPSRDLQDSQFNEVKINL